jgi:hypothetical protein
MIYRSDRVKENILISDDQAALYLIRKGAVRESHVQLLYTALKDLLEMPEYDGTRTTSQVRLRAKNAAKRALKAVEKGEYETDS